jgi:uncharacterized membrane protein
MIRRTSGDTKSSPNVLLNTILMHLPAPIRSRFRNYRMARYIFYITAFWAISIYLAPLTLEPGTVEELDANANWLDYGDQWGDMATYNPFAAAVYAFGDFNCHQRHTRTLDFHGNQMPVCARDVGIAWGAMAGAVLLFFVIRTPFMFLTFLSIVPEKLRTTMLKRMPPWLAAGIVAFPFIIPTGFDGFYQLLTDYESTNTVRLVTGFFLGVILAWGFGSAFMSITVPLPTAYPSPTGRPDEKPENCPIPGSSHPPTEPNQTTPDSTPESPSLPTSTPEISPPLTTTPADTPENPLPVSESPSEYATAPGSNSSDTHNTANEEVEP